MTGQAMRMLGRLFALALSCALAAPAHAQWTPSGAAGQSALAISDPGKALALASGARVLVVGQEDKRLTVIDPDAGTVLGQVVLPHEPRSVAISADGLRAFVVYGNDKLTAVDVVARTVLATWSIGGDLRSVVLMAGETELAVADAGPNRLLGIDPSTGSVVREVALSHEPRELIAANGGSRLAVGATNGWLVTMDTASFTVTSQLKLADEIRSLAWWEAGGRLLAVHKRADAVSLVDLAIPQVTATVALDGDPDRAAIAAGVGYLGTHDDASVNRVDLTGATLLGRYAIASRVSALVFDPVANVLYGAPRGDEKLLRLDPAAASLISVLQLAKRLRDVSINSTTHEAVAVADKSDEMFIVTLSDRSVRNIALPARPDLVAVDSTLNHAVVAFRGSGPKLRFVDLAANSLFAETVDFDKNLNAIAVDPTRALALAIADGNKPVLLVDLNTRTRLADGPAERYRALALHAGRGVAYLATEDRQLKVMDLASRAITATVELGFKANAIAVDEALDKALITTGTQNKAHVLDLSTLILQGSHALPNNPGAVSLQPDTHVAVVASRESDALSLVDLASGVATPSFTSIEKAHTVAVSARYNEAVVLSGERDEVAFVQLPNPVPALQTLSPSQVPAGSPLTTITIGGTGFVNASTAYFGATALATRWQSATELQADIPASLLAAPGGVPVTVQNPAPAGGTSNALSFAILGAPALAAVAPSSAVADGQPKTLQLAGANFASGAAVLFGATSLPAAFNSATSLTVVVPGSLTSAAGTVQVSVVNPGGLVSNALAFSLTPQLAISGFTPASGPIGTAVAISGAGFDPNLSANQVRFNGETAVIASGGASLLNAIVPPRATSGPITVANALGTATSATAFTVEEREAFDITLAPAAIQVPLGGQGGTRVRLSSIGLNPYPYAASVAITGLPAGVTASFDRPSVALNLDSIVTLSAAAGASSGTFNVTLTATGASGVTTQVVTKTLALQVLAAGSTSVSGRVLHAEDDKPFVGARVRLGAQAVLTDETGTYRFVSPALLGDQVVLVDGNTANGPDAEYPSGIALPVAIVAGQDNKALTSFLARIDPSKFTEVVPGQFARVTNPDIPNFALRIPQGATLFGWDGQPVTKINVRTVPVDRLPIRPIPAGVETRSVYLYYFFREGGANPTQPIPVTMPNDIEAAPGEQVTMWYYDESATADPSSNQWRVMGSGTVSADGKSVVSNPGVGMPKFCCGASFLQRTPGPGTGGNGGNGGQPPSNPPPPQTCNPVDLASGNALAFRPRPFGISKFMAVNPNCQYRSTDTRVGLFGRGMSFTYDWFAQPNGSQAVTVTNPAGVRFILSREEDGVFRSRSGRSGAIEMEVTPTGTGRTLRLVSGISYEFDSAGRLLAAVDLAGNRTTFQLNTFGFPQSMTDAAGKIYSFQLVGTAPFIRISRITDPAGRSIEFTYDTSQRLTSYKDQGGGVTTFDYDANDRIRQMTDPRLAVKTLEYDAAGRASRETLPESAEERFEYTAIGGTVAETRHTDANGNVTTYRFNGLGFNTQVIDAIGRVTRYELDPVNNLLRRMTDAAGRVTQYTYNQRGDLIRVIDPDNKQTLIDYDLRFRRPTRVENALGHVTLMEYNSQGNLTKFTNAENETTTFTYTARGQLETITDPLNRVTRFTYDSEGNLIESTNPADEMVIRAYDLANRLTEVTDSLNRTTRFTYDALDRVTEVRDAIQGLTKFTYDANDNLLSATDPNNNPVERNVYDLRNRLKQRTDAKNRSTTYDYDGVGNLTRMTDRKGQITDYTYDAVNRLTQIQDHDGRTTTYSYDVVGNLARVSDTQSGDILMSYDSLDRLTEVITPQGTVVYTYDAIGRRLTTTLSGGDISTYAYDKANRLKTVVLRGKMASYSYDLAGRLTEKVLPNGLKATYQYDAADRVISIAYTKPDNTTLETVTYAYDTAGQRVQKALGTGSVQETPASTTYDEANRLTSVTLSGETFTLAYDDNGNLASKSGPTSGTTTYAWNARDQLTAISGSSGNASFKYDAFGRRVEKTVNGITTGFIYDGSQAIAELDGVALGTVYHTGIEIDEVLARYAPLGNKTLLTDALMSVIAQSNDDQSMQNFYAYTPYGEATTLGADEGNPLQYTGRENDGTGVYYYRARYYDPVWKRFISEDPTGIAAGVNIYAYVGGNPVSYVDPQGNLLEVIEVAHLVWGYGNAVIMAGLTGVAIGTIIRLGVEYGIGDTIGGKIADAAHPLPSMVSPTPPALITPPMPPAPSASPSSPTPPAPSTPQTRPNPRPPTSKSPGIPPMPPATPSSGPCWWPY